MIEFVLFLYAVNSHQLFWPNAGHFTTKEQCEYAIEDMEIEKSGQLYGLCYPVIPGTYDPSTSRVR